MAICWGLLCLQPPGRIVAQERPTRPKKAVESAPPGASKPAPAQTGAAQPADPVREEILKVNYIFNRGLFDLALPKYEQILEANPTYARADLLHYPLALCHYNLATQEAKDAKKPAASAEELAAGRKEHLKKVAFHLKESLKRKDFESRAAAMRLLGQTLLLQDDWDGAAKTFQFLIDKMPDSPEAPLARLGLAESQYQQGKFAEAAKTYRDALTNGASTEDTDRAEFYLAMSLYKSGEAGDEAKLAESVAAFEKLSEKKSAKGSARYSLDARYMLALARQASGDLTGAAEAFRGLAAAGSKEYSELAQFGLGAALFRSGKHKEAQAELEKFLTSYPASDRRDEASLLVARAQLELKQTTPAAKQLQELRSSPRVGDEASLYLARIFSRHGKPKSAVTVLSQALKSFPESRLREDLELDLISAQVADGNFQGALTEIGRVEAAGAAGSTADQAAYLKAYALHRAKRLDESSAACAQFRASFSKSRYLKDVLQIDAENKLLSGDAAGAKKAYEEFLERFGKDVDAATRLKARFRSAQTLYIAKDYANALQVFEAIQGGAHDADETSALRDDPVLQTLGYLVGECAYQIKDYARAQRELTEFLARTEGKTGLETEMADSRFKIAHSLELAGDSKQAREAFQGALKADPKSAHREQILFELGQIDYALKDPASASRSFEALLADFPTSRFVPHALKFLGWIAYEAKDAQKSVDCYQKLLAGFPDHAAASDAHYHLALGLKMLGRNAESRQALLQFREKNPGDPRAGQSEIEEAADLSREKKYDEALQILTRLRAQNPKADALPSILYETAWCHRGRGDLEMARKAYEELLGARPPLALLQSSTLELGELELEAKNYPRAKEILAPLAAAQGPQREKALYRHIWALQLLGEAEGLTREYETFVKDFPGSELTPELGVLAAKAYVARGEAAKALPIFQSIAKNRPDTPEAEAAMVSWGECLAEQGSFEEARSRFEAFLKRYPGSSLGHRARFGTAWALENLGQSEKSMDLYREVVKETRTALGARAQFQLGQCLVAKKDYKAAIVEFLQVPAGFSFAEWSSKALLQVAGCFEALEDAENARKYYAEVKQSYPGRDEAKLAEERLQKLETQ